MVKVSIIVPVYNGESYIDRCLDSLLKQTLQDIEIILVNDGSTDDTLKIISKYEDPKLKVISIENQGQGKARNIGVTYAKGEYLGFVDSDDYVDEKMFQSLYDVTLKSRADLVICPYYRVTSQQEILFVEMMNCKHDYLNINTSPWNKLFKTSVWKNHQIQFAENLWYEDLQAVLSFLFVAERVEWTNIPFYYYVQRDNSSINQFNEKVEDIFSVFNNLTDFISKNKVLRNQETIEYYYIMHLIFGHLSRCAVEPSFIKRHQLIMNTKCYLAKTAPNYLHNKNFKLLSIDKSSLGMFLIKYIGFITFKFNLYDLFLILYRFKLHFNKSIKRW